MSRIQSLVVLVILLVAGFSLEPVWSHPPPDPATESVQEANDQLDDAGAPLFHTWGQEGHLLVTDQKEIFKGERMADLQMALNFDPVVRRSIVHGIERQREFREKRKGSP